MLDAVDAELCYSHLGDITIQIKKIQIKKLDKLTDVMYNKFKNEAKSFK